MNVIPGSTKCSECPAGTITSEIGSINFTKYSAGSIPDIMGSSFNKCNKGYYPNIPGSKKSEKYSPGTISSEIGSTN